MLFLAFMALNSSSTVETAIAQYRDNMRYWESADTAKNLYEAVLFLLEYNEASISVAGRSVQRADLLRLRDELAPIINAASAAPVTQVALVQFARPA